MASSTDTANMVASRKPIVVLGIVALSVLLGVAGLTWWAIAQRGRPTPAGEGPGFEQYRQGWESAMAKAGVEATFPPGPVSVQDVVVQGRAPFDATFTAEEIGALLNVYTFESPIGNTTVSVSGVDVAFPQAGVASIDARLAADNAVYSVSITLPLEHSAKGISSSGATDLEAEGFSVGGERRRQASDALVAYLNLYLRAAPGLVVERAEILEGSVSVTGMAPVTIEHPLEPYTAPAAP